MRFLVLLAFSAIWSVSLATQLQTSVGAARSVFEIAADFERLTGVQPKTNSPAPASTASKPSTSPKTIDEIKYPLESPAAPVNRSDAEIWELLQAKQAKLKKVKEEILDLIHKRNELLSKQNGKAKEQMDKIQAAIIRAIDFNVAYKANNL